MDYPGTGKHIKIGMNCNPLTYIKMVTMFFGKNSSNVKHACPWSLLLFIIITIIYLFICIIVAPGSPSHGPRCARLWYVEHTWFPLSIMGTEGIKHLPGGAQHFPESRPEPSGRQNSKNVSGLIKC